MDETRAKQMIERYCDALAEPLLHVEDIEGLLADHAAAPDADGVLPSEDGWVPTYSVRGVWLAIAEGWALKAGRIAGRFDFTTDGQSFRRSQAVDHCAAQAARYRRKANQSAPVG